MLVLITARAIEKFGFKVFAAVMQKKFFDFAVIFLCYVRLMYKKVSIYILYH